MTLVLLAALCQHGTMIVKERPLQELISEFDTWRSDQKAAELYDKKTQTAVNFGCSGAVLFGLSFLMAGMSRKTSDGVFLLGTVAVCMVLYGIYSVYRLGSYSKVPKTVAFEPQLLEGLLSFLKAFNERVDPSSVTKIETLDAWSSDHRKVSDVLLLERRKKAVRGLLHRTSSSDSSKEGEMLEYPREETRRWVLLQGSVTPPQGVPINFQVVREERVALKLVYEYQGSGDQKRKVFVPQTNYLSVFDTFEVRTTPANDNASPPKEADIDLQGFKILKAPSSRVSNEGELVMEVSLEGEGAITCFEPIHRLMRPLLDVRSWQNA